LNARRSAFDAGASFVRWSRGISQNASELREFIQRWRLGDPTTSDLRGDYALFLMFRKLPPSHRAVKDWFMVGVQFAQWAPEVKNLPQWDTWSEEDGELTQAHFRWAFAISRFQDALEDTGLEPTLIDELEADFRRCRGAEAENKLTYLRRRLRHIAQSFDNEFPLPEMGQGQDSTVTVNIGSIDMTKAKYDLSGTGTIIGENAKVSGSFNKHSQVSLRPEVEQAFKTVAAVAKKAKNERARKDLQALKREARKKSPDTSKMQSIWNGVVKAVPAVAAEAGKAAVDAITGLFS
jgi:hypothetical protein